MDPFRILNIPLKADSSAIMKAVVVALKKKEYSTREIAEAQKKLLNPLKRIYFTSNRIFFEPIENEMRQQPKTIKKSKIEHPTTSKKENFVSQDIFSLLD